LQYPLSPSKPRSEALTDIGLFAYFDKPPPAARWEHRVVQVIELQC